jgi:hypothetical protein
MQTFLTPVLPAGNPITVLPDRGFLHEQFIGYAQRYHFTSIGVAVVRANVRRWVDTHWDRGLSYFKIGWRWLLQQYRRTWQIFATFWLDPAPAIASRRQAALPGRSWTLVQIC